MGPGETYGHIDDWETNAVDYLDGKLDPSDKAAFEQHVAECPRCSARMARQQAVITLLQRAPLDDAPEDLQDKILGELLFPSDKGVESRFRGVLAEKPVRKSWTKRFRPWIPVTSAVAVVLIGIVLFGILRSEDAEAPTARYETVNTAAADQTVAAGAPSEMNVASTTTAAGAHPETTAATAAASPSTVTSSAGLSVASTPSTLLDRKQIVKTLESAEGPAYIAFETVSTSEESTTTASVPLTQAAAPPDSPTSTQPGLPSDRIDEIASEITTFTGLEQLSSDMSLAGPTFAAFISRKQLAPFMDLLSSIKASVQVDSPVHIDLVLRLEPELDVRETASLIESRKTELPLLEAHVAPQPAVNRYTFTTAAPPDKGPGSSVQMTPDEAGTHILVVIVVRR